jgi:ABC-type uncharacterized transport system substrate-binding protein
MMLLRILKYGPALLMLLPSVALAHPHVWVMLRSALIFNADGFVQGIGQEWSFDDTYAAEALDGMDTNHDGKYSEAELEPLTKENMDSLKDYDYFTFPKNGDDKLQTAPPINAVQTYKDKRLQLYFEIPLLAPLDPHGANFNYRIYDPEFFIAYDYAKKLPVEVNEAMPKDCKFTLRPLLSNAELAATQTMLATKDKTWKPENGEDYGALFAQPVVVSCG